MRRLGTLSGTWADYHVRFGGSGPSYPRDGPTPDRLQVSILQVVDEEVVMPGGSRHAPRPRQAVAGGSPEAGRDEDRIADVIRPVIAAAGMDLESVRVSAAGRRRLLRVVVDSDRGVSLDDAASISHQLSSELDTLAVMGDFPYTLEVFPRPASTAR